MSARTAPPVTRTARRLWALACTALLAGAAEARTAVELHLAGREVAVDVYAPAGRSARRSSASCSSAFRPARLLAAATAGVVGYVGLDPFDRVDGHSALGRGFAPTLRAAALQRERGRRARFHPSTASRSSGNADRGRGRSAGGLSAMSPAATHHRRIEPRYEAVDMDAPARSPLKCGQ